MDFSFFIYDQRPAMPYKTLKKQFEKYFYALRILNTNMYTLVGFELGHSTGFTNGSIEEGMLVMYVLEKY